MDRRRVEERAERLMVVGDDADAAAAGMCGGHRRDRPGGGHTDV